MTRRSRAVDVKGTRRRLDPSLPEGDEKSRAVRGLFDTISPRYDLVNRVMTFGLDVGWRRRAVRELRLPGRSLVLDLACGTGDLCRELLASGYRAVGFDFSFGMLAAANTSAPLVGADILQLPLLEGAADGATCGFALRNVVSLPRFFAELGRVVRAGGRISLLEVSEPENPLLRAGNGVYFKHVVPMVGGLLSDRAAYSYLPRSMAYLPAPAEIMALLRESGFTDVRRVQLSGGVTQLLVGTRS
jgi:demethylmenaquinone methyltransferase/2-methoxy-6-polyprenyl-1,4-benzoquinol methylase